MKVVVSRGICLQTTMTDFGGENYYHVHFKCWHSSFLMLHKHMVFDVSQLALPLSFSQWFFQMQFKRLDKLIKQQKQYRKQNARYCCRKDHVFSTPVPFGGGGGGGIQH